VRKHAIRKRGLAAVLAAAFAVSGCATLVSGREQMIEIDTVNVKDANCWGTDKEGRKYTWFGTPIKTQVIKGDGPIAVRCEAKGFKTEKFQIEERVSGAMALNILTFGVGFLVDASSGAAQPYPDVVRIPLAPVDAAPASARAAYEAAKKRIVEEEKKRKAKEEEEIRKASN